MAFDLRTSLYAFNIGATAYSQYKTGDYKSDIAAINQEIADEQSNVAIRRGVQQEHQLRREYAQLRGTQRAIMAAQGLDLEEDTALNIQLDTKRQEELDVLTLRNNTMMEAWGYKVSSYNYSQQGKIAKKEGNLGALETVFAGAADYALATGNPRLKFGNGK